MRLLRTESAASLVALLLALVALLVVALPAYGAGARGSLDVTFTGSSTLHGFEGRVEDIPYVARSGDDGDGWSVDIAVPVESLDTGNGVRDHKMRSMFDAEHFPHIGATIRGARFVVVDGRVAVPETIELDLTIRDITRRVRAVVSGVHQVGEQLSFEAGLQISLHEFGLVPPSVLFVKVADAVDVRITVRTVEF